MAQVNGVDYLCTLTLFTSGSISTWRVAERFFAEFFSFLFDNTSQCYFVFASLFPTLQDLLFFFFFFTLFTTL